MIYLHAWLLSKVITDSCNPPILGTQFRDLPTCVAYLQGVDRFGLPERGAFEHLDHVADLQRTITTSLSPQNTIACSRQRPAFVLLKKGSP